MWRYAGGLFVFLAACTEGMAGPSPGEVGSADLTTDELPPALEGDGTPADRPAPAAGSIRSCGAAKTAAEPLRVYTLVPETRPVSLGEAVSNGAPSGPIVVEGEHEQEATTPSITQLFAGPDQTRLTGWLGGNPLIVWGSQEAHDNFVSRVRGVDPLTAWGSAVSPTKRRLTYSVAFSEEEFEYELTRDTVTLAPGANTSADARFVSEFRAHRYFGVTLGFDTASECAVGALADALGETPVIRKGAPNPTPDRGALFDADKRAQLEDLLVRDGAQPFVAIVSNRPRPEIEAKVRASTCSSADLGACAALVDELGAMVSAASAGTEPSDYDALTKNQSEWSITAFVSAKVSGVR